MEIYYLTEPLHTGGLVNAIDPRMRHAAIIINDPVHGLLRIELDRAKTTNQLSVVSLDILNIENLTGDFTKGQIVYKIGTADASLNQITGWANEWLSKNPKYKPLSKNCRSFFDYVTKRIFKYSTHQFEGVGFNRINGDRFFKSPIEEIEHRIKKFFPNVIRSVTPLASSTPPPETTNTHADVEASSLGVAASTPQENVSNTPSSDSQGPRVFIGPRIATPKEKEQLEFNQDMNAAISAGVLHRLGYSMLEHEAKTGTNYVAAVLKDSASSSITSFLTQLGVCLVKDSNVAVKFAAACYLVFTTSKNDLTRHGFIQGAGRIVLKTTYRTFLPSIFSGFLDAKSDCNDYVSDLCQAAYSGDLVATIKTLNSTYFAIVNKPNQSGYLALGLAASYGHEQVVGILLQYNADVNSVDKDGYTAIMYAAGQGYSNLVRRLLNHPKIDLTLKNNKNLNAHDFAIGRIEPDLIEMLRVPGMLAMRAQ